MDRIYSSHKVLHFWLTEIHEQLQHAFLSLDRVLPLRPRILVHQEHFHKILVMTPGFGQHLCSLALLDESLNLVQVVPALQMTPIAYRHPQSSANEFLREPLVLLIIIHRQIPTSWLSVDNTSHSLSTWISSHCSQRVTRAMRSISAYTSSTRTPRHQPAAL